MFSSEEMIRTYGTKPVPRSIAPCISSYFAQAPAMGGMPMIDRVAMKKAMKTSGILRPRPLMSEILVRPVAT